MSDLETVISSSSVMCLSTVLCVSTAFVVVECCGLTRWAAKHCAAACSLISCQGNGEKIGGKRKFMD